MNSWWGRVALCVLLACAACTDKPSKTPASATSPALVRTPTAGDALWKRLPVGADLLVEIDLRRLRDNPRTGPLISLMSPPAPLRDSDLLSKADTLIIAVYHLGDAPKQLLLLQGPALTGLASQTLGDNTIAVGDPELVRAAEGLQLSSATMADDAQLLQMRAQAMPEKAEAATLRLVARLDFDARVAIASQLAVSEVPLAISIWADVVDDLAIVARLEGESSAQAQRLERAMGALQERLSRMSFVRFLALAPPLQAAKLIRSSSSVRVVFVLAPKRLALVVKRLQQQLSLSMPVKAPSAPPAPSESTP